MNRLQRPVDPSGLALWGALPVPVGDHYVEGLLYQCSDLVITMGEALQPPDEGEVESKRLGGLEVFEGADVVAGPYEGVVLDDLVLHPQQPPHRQQD